MVHWFGRKRLYGFLAGLCLVLVLGVCQAPLMAQSSPSRGTISEILDSDQVYIQSNQAQVNDVANRGQQVRTGSARAQVNLNTGVVARLGSNSTFTIGECAQLQQGVLLINGAANGCTSSTIAGARGTTYILEVDPSGEERVKVLEGEVIVTKAQDASTGVADDTAETVTLESGEKVSTRPGEELGDVERISLDDFVDILTGELFSEFLEELPGYEVIRATFEDLFPGTPFPLEPPNLLDDFNPF